MLACTIIMMPELRVDESNICEVYGLLIAWTEVPVNMWIVGRLLEGVICEAGPIEESRPKCLTASGLQRLYEMVKLGPFDRC